MTTGLYFLEGEAWASGPYVNHATWADTQIKEKTRVKKEMKLLTLTTLLLGL